MWRERHQIISQKKSNVRHRVISVWVNGKRETDNEHCQVGGARPQCYLFIHSYWKYSVAIHWFWPLIQCFLIASNAGEDKTRPTDCSRGLKARTRTRRRNRRYGTRCSARSRQCLHTSASASFSESLFESMSLSQSIKWYIASRWEFELAICRQMAGSDRTRSHSE